MAEFLIKKVHDIEEQLAHAKEVEMLYMIEEKKHIKDGTSRTAYMTSPPDLCFLDIPNLESSLKETMEKLSKMI